MKLQAAFCSIITVLATLSIGITAKADTVDARCDVYPLREDKASDVVPCTFSQRQGYVTIVLENGMTYELTPSPTQAAIYTDQEGRPAFREDGLGDEGLIFRTAEGAIFVYWDATIGSE
jgi:hypothetical protein